MKSVPLLLMPGRNPAACMIISTPTPSRSKTCEFNKALLKAELLADKFMAWAFKNETIAGPELIEFSQSTQSSPLPKTRTFLNKSIATTIYPLQARRF
jgi:hypothetical protein